MRRGWDWGGDDDDYYDPYRTSDFDIIGGSCQAVPEPCYPLKKESTKVPQPMATSSSKQKTCMPVVAWQSRSPAHIHNPGRQPVEKSRGPAPTGDAQVGVKRTPGGLKVWGGRIEDLLQNRPHGLFLKMLEKMYEKAWGEALPLGWLDEMEAMGRMVVERKASSVDPSAGCAQRLMQEKQLHNPICSLPSVENDSKAVEQQCKPVLGAWDVFEVVVCGVWQEEALLGVNIIRLRDKKELEKLQKDMQAHYSSESNRERLGGAKEGSLVAVLHQEAGWCRGRLVSIAGNLVIYLLDCGKLMPIPVLPQSTVLKLAPEFSILPTAAIRGELDGVKLKEVGGGKAAVDWLEAKLIGEQKTFKAEIRWRLGKYLALSLTNVSMPAPSGNVAQQLIKCGFVETTPF